MSASKTTQPMSSEYSVRAVFSSRWGSERKQRTSIHLVNNRSANGLLASSIAIFSGEAVTL